MWIIMLLFLSIPLLALAWKSFRKAMLDHARDNMFDLREKLRSDFIKNNWGLDSVEYKNMRDLINCAIRYAEDKTLGDVITINRIISKNEKVLKSVSDFKKRILHSKNIKIREYLQETYNALTDEIFFYLLSTSVIALIALMLVLLACVIINPFIKCHSKFLKPKNEQMDDFLVTACERNNFASQTV